MVLTQGAPVAWTQLPGASTMHVPGAAQSTQGRTGSQSGQVPALTERTVLLPPPSHRSVLSACSVSDAGLGAGGQQ